MNGQSICDIVREYYAAYESKNSNGLESLLSADFRFSSPLDDRIDKTAYLERCWPNSERIRAFHIKKLFERNGDVFVLYELEPITGQRSRNVEFFRIEDGKIVEVEVYFGTTRPLE